MNQYIDYRRAFSSRVRLLAIACILAPGYVPASDFLFMPTVAVVNAEGSRDDPSVEKHELIGDLFYSHDKGRFRLLSELEVDPAWNLDSIDYDMERLQVGWQIWPETTLWFGRYHNPIGYWTMEHHHGHYMETSAERPRIVEFEDEGGPLPIHLTGFLLQGTKLMDEASLEYDIGIASGPRIINDKLEPVDVIRDPRWNKLALVARVTYRPDAAIDNQYGAFVARTDIPIYTLETKEIEQDMAGLYFSRDFDRFRIFSEVFDIKHRLIEGAGVTWPSYWAGYAQAEYQVVPEVWTAFARYEAISNHLTADYLDTFSQLPKNREIAGVRWDFYEFQALKLEAIRDTAFSNTVFNGFELQWSALFQ